MLQLQRQRALHPKMQRARLIARPAGRPAASARSIPPVARRRSTASRPRCRRRQGHDGPAPAAPLSAAGCPGSGCASSGRLSYGRYRCPPSASGIRVLVAGKLACGDRSSYPSGHQVPPPRQDRHENREYAGPAAGLVRPAPAQPALARAAGPADRALPRVAQRDHAAADHGGDGRALLPGLPGALAHRARPGAGGSGCRAPCLAGPGLLRPGQESPQMRQGGQPGLGGRFPEREAELLELPGIGPYTAAAIAAIAFDRHGHRHGRQCGAGDGAALRGRRRRCRRPSPNCGAWRRR